MCGAPAESSSMSTKSLRTSDEKQTPFALPPLGLVLGNSLDTPSMLGLERSTPSRLERVTPSRLSFSRRNRSDPPKLTLSQSSGSCRADSSGRTVAAISAFSRFSSRFLKDSTAWKFEEFSTAFLFFSLPFEIAARHWVASEAARGTWCVLMPCTATASIDSRFGTAPACRMMSKEPGSCSAMFRRVAAASDSRLTKEQPTWFPRSFTKRGTAPDCLEVKSYQEGKGNS
mmetsp:Transcript_20471/g.56763  ORF Transcript_20471/g.56763 Transcript_20471/m.56763 type:complete len:229 (+) Transcript_20471:418-1104(+)